MDILLQWGRWCSARLVAVLWLLAGLSGSAKQADPGCSKRSCTGPGDLKEDLAPPGTGMSLQNQSVARPPGWSLTAPSAR